MGWSAGHFGTLGPFSAWHLLIIMVILLMLVRPGRGR
ncbi:MAG: twin-arginine translocase TatA/TatE family subunit [Proteobacteria bacterium]|nr:twin-arginine translocase TatA/TatE family subunit [Pseudomonadota bacterium]